MIPLYKVLMADPVSSSVIAALHSGFIGEGARVQEFEQLLSREFGGEEVVATNSCTSALQLAIQLTPEVGEEIVTTPLCCFASVSSILSQGCKPKFVDIGSDGNIDVSEIAGAINENTRAVLVVHNAGYPCQMNQIFTIVSEWEDKLGRSIPVIEDCANAMWSYEYGKLVGLTTRGVWHFRCFSFQATKILTTGDGGAIVLHKTHVERARKLRWYGIDRSIEDRYSQDIGECGNKWHMNDVAAAIGLGNFVASKVCANHVRENRLAYTAWLRTNPKIRLLGMQTTSEFMRTSSACSQLLVEVPNAESFNERMMEEGIETKKNHGRCDLHSCLPPSSANLHNLERLYPKLTSIPAGWWMDQRDIQKVATSITKVLR